MITSPAFRGKRYAVLGLARSGAATVDALVASGAEVVAWDTKEEMRLALIERLAGQGRGPDGAVEHWWGGEGTGWHGGDGKVEVANLECEELAEFEALVLSPGVPLNRDYTASVARTVGTPIIGDIELFAQARASLPPHKVVGITGTNGKSTTTALVHHILKTAGVPTEMGGNIGLPILAQDPLPEGGVYVLELSSYQIDLTFSLDCDVAVLLNVTPDHLDRYESFRAYAESKERLFFLQSPGQIAVIVCDNEDGPTLIDKLAHFEDRGLDIREPRSGGDTEGDAVVVDGTGYLNGQPLGRQETWLALQGPHNAQNAAAAIAVASALGVEPGLIAEGLQTYPGLPDRMERVAEKDGILFVNDSKATNPDSTAPALAAFPYIHWIVGGLAKTHSLGPCEAQLGHVRAAYTIGDSGPMFAQLLAGKVPVTECGVLTTAVEKAADAAVTGEVVLLSPACASFDQFRDYEARGQAFRDAVGALS